MLGVFWVWPRCRTRTLATKTRFRWYPTFDRMVCHLPTNVGLPSVRWPPIRKSGGYIFPLKRSRYILLYNICRTDKIRYHTFNHGSSIVALSKIVSPNSRLRKHRKCFLNREKCSECLPSPFTLSIYFWNSGQLCCGPVENCPHIFSSATFSLETVFGFGWKFQNNFMCLSPDMIFPRYSNMESY